MPTQLQNEQKDKKKAETGRAPLDAPAEVRTCISLRRLRNSRGSPMDFSLVSQAVGAGRMMTTQEEMNRWGKKYGSN